MKQLGLSILILLMSALCFAQSLGSHRQIVILSSIRSQESGILRRDQDDIENSISKRFESAFQGSGYDYVIVHKATMKQLEFYLNSEQTLALFWISHAASVAAGGNGMEIQADVLDYNGNNVAPIFQKVGNHLLSLSVVGCTTASILDDYRKQGFYSNNAGLHLFGLDKKRSLAKAIKLSIADAVSVLQDKTERFRGTFKAIPYLDQLPSANTETSPQITFSVSPLPAGFTAQVSTQGHFLGIIDPGKPFFSVDRKLLNSRTKILITIDKAYPVSAPVLQFHSEMISINGQSYFADENGNLLGSKQNLYYLSL